MSESTAMQAPKDDRPQTLAEFFGVDKTTFHLIAPSTFAHTIIDPQYQYAKPGYVHGNAHTDEISDKIASITPLFRTLTKTAIVYYDPNNRGIDKSAGGLYKLSAMPSDITIAKSCNDAFEGSNILETLQENNIKTLFVSGFNSGYCVKDTVASALKHGFNVVVMSDCVGQDKREPQRRITKDLQEMEDMGAYIATSEEALHFLNTVREASL